MRTPRLTLVPHSIDDARRMVDALSAADKAHVSADWLAQLAAATTDDPWLLGFSVVERETGATVGQCGFKGPPQADGIVEIAYGIAPEHQGRGYATEAAIALVQYALDSDRVRVVRAHTLTQANASTRVLSKCGFHCVGEVIDPEDGPVWRWEKPLATTGG